MSGQGLVTKPTSGGAGRDHRQSEAFGPLSLPALFRSADMASVAAQRTLFALRGTQLALLVLAAIAGVYHVESGNGGVDWAGVVAAVAFVTGALLETTLLTMDPEKSWYQGRAVAESAKTLAWRYAMRATPFEAVDSERAADELLSQRFRDLIADFQRAELVPVQDDGHEITQWMRTTRSGTVHKRRREYLEHRVDDQRRWYTAKAVKNHRTAVSWSVAMVGVQTVGVVVAVLKAATVIDVDLLGVIAAVTVAAVAWLEIRQHATLAQAYSVAAHELSSIRPLLEKDVDDSTWSTLINDAEMTISREHTSWQAARR